MKTCPALVVSILFGPLACSPAYSDLSEPAEGVSGDADPAVVTGSGEPPGGYASMAPRLLEPLPRGPVHQWQYHEVEGARCRDGSPAGLYTRFSETSTNLVIYLEQGGACFNPALCAYNPQRVGDSITGRTMTETISGMRAGVRQAPPATGIFDVTRSENPVRDWNMVWIPYCTGDAHAGSHPDAVVPGVSSPQQFVGYTNMQKFVGRIVPTFASARHVVLAGSSAGSFGAGLSYNQVQDAFGAVPVTLIADSGIPFSDTFMAACLQRTWRELWNFETLLPPECTECRSEDGGGMLDLVFFSARKYPDAKLGIVSASEDDVMRFFFAFGENECAGASSYPPGKYTQALDELRGRAAPYAAQFASYYVSGITHMYLSFDDFYEPLAGGDTLASWMSDLIAGEPRNVGP